jgi:hypothetical protein
MAKYTLYFKHAVAVFLLFAVLSATAPFPLMAQSHADNRNITVIGTGRIENENITSARKDAISDALVSVVGLVASDLLHPLVLVESFDEVNRLLLFDTSSFVQYKVLTETTSGKTYRVIVQANVSVDKIQDLLTRNGILVQNETQLKVLLLIAEKGLEEMSYQSWWEDSFTTSVSEAALSNALSSQGLVVLDHGQFLPATLESRLSEMENPPGKFLSDAQAAYFGEWYQADIVIVGTAAAERASNALGDELRSFKGILAVRAIRTDTGEILSQSTRNVLIADAEDSTGTRKALTEVGTKTGAFLAVKIQRAWQEATSTGPLTATIVVKGGYQLAHFVTFRKMLSELPDLTGLQTKGITPEETVLEFQYEGTTQGLAEMLLLKSSDDFGIHITEAAPEMIRLMIVPN